MLEPGKLYLPPAGEVEARSRVSAALMIADQLSGYDGEHHALWVIDQMVRALTGCPVETVHAEDVHGTRYTYDALGKSGEYEQFRDDHPSWDEGIAP